MTGVPTVITDLSTTAASNSPAGSDSIGTNLDEYLRATQSFVRQLFDTGTIFSSTVGGTADVITLTPTPALTAHKAGQAIAWLQSGANTTNVTVNPSAIGAKAVTKNGTTALVAGDLPSGAIIVARYDGTQYQLESASTAFTAPPFLDTNALIKGSSDATKLIRFEVDGLTTGTTRTITAPDKSGTMAMTSDLASYVLTVKRQVFPSSGTYTPSAGMSYCDIELWGAGGGGGGVTATVSCQGGGGGAGGYAKKVVTAATIGVSQIVTVGAGGTAGANTGGTGGTGGTTSVGAIVSATGGAGGVGSTSGNAVNGGAGGVGSSGDINAKGAAGFVGTQAGGSAWPIGGYGGATSLGGSPVQVQGNTSAVGASAQANSGAGGGGAISQGTAEVGGLGGSGYVVITEYCSQ